MAAGKLAYIELRALENVLRERQPSEGSGTHFVNKLAERDLVQTRTDCALSKLPVER